MTEQKRQQLETLITEGYRFRLGDYISQAFDLFQRSAGNFIGFALVAGLMTIVAGFIPFLGQLLSNFILTPCLAAGAYLAAYTLDKREPLEFNRFFKGFDFVGQLALVTLVIGIISIISMIPMFVAWSYTDFFGWFKDVIMSGAPAIDVPDFPNWSLLLLLPAVYFYVSYTWAPLFIVFYDMTFWEAMEMSRRLITKNWLIIFLFNFILGLFLIVGALMLILGLLVAVPVIYCAQYAAFRDVTRLGEDTEQDITDHLVA